jgi:hypothetical protein
MVQAAFIIYFWNPNRINTHSGEIDNAEYVGRVIGRRIGTGGSGALLLVAAGRCWRQGHKN